MDSLITDQTQETIAQTSPEVATPGGGSTASPRAEIVTFPAWTRIPGLKSMALRQEILVTVEWTNDGVLISADSLDEDGYGATYWEACWDFLTSMRDRLGSLSSRESVLSVGDRMVLDRLRAAIKLYP